MPDLKLTDREKKLMEEEQLDESDIRAIRRTRAAAKLEREDREQREADAKAEREKKEKEEKEQDQDIIPIL